jgi:DnaJ-class molecular chaperone
VDIDIPRGINDGDNVRYPGIGPGGVDVVITFRIHPDPRWQRNGLDLHTEHTVELWDLILGNETPVQDILGNVLSLSIPPRTQPGTVLRLRGRGLAQRSGTPGDLLVHIQTRIPDNIPEEIVEVVRKYQTNK